MTVELLASDSAFKPVTLPDKQREIRGGYVGDLLSWVMGRAEADDALITIMSNLNVVAVASLADTACVIFAEGVTPDAELIRVAESKGINLITTDLSSYEAAVKLSVLLR